MPKRPINVSVSPELLNQVRELDINVSAVVETALQELVVRRRREAWLAENQAALAAYRRKVEADGVFSDGLRTF